MIYLFFHSIQQQGVFKIATYITALVLSAYLSNPFLTLAQGNIESNLNHLVTGDKGKSVGAFQVQARHWGDVPKDFLGQAKQYQRIMLELVAKNQGDVWEAVEDYNGSGKQAVRYREKVQREVLRVAML